MKNIPASLICLLFAVTGCHPKLQPQTIVVSQDRPIIEALEVIGRRQISEDKVTKAIHSRPGTRLDPAVVKADIKNLQALGFKHVRAEERPGEIAGFNGRILRFVVQEN